MANMAVTGIYNPNIDKTNSVPYADLILNTMTNNSLSVWGFVIVRCSYNDQTKWEAFLANVKGQTLEEGSKVSVTPSNQLNELLRWTIIEDRENLEGASMQVASSRFDEWVKTVGREEVRTSPFNIVPH